MNGRWMKFLCFSSLTTFSLALFLSLFTSIFWRSRFPPSLRIFARCTLLTNSSSRNFLRCSSCSPLLCFSPDWSCSSNDSIFNFTTSNSCQYAINCRLVISAVHLILAAASVFSVATFRCSEKNPCTL